ncbi:MAG TPA: electron transfer flavoprotein subunit beta/FixA family protein [Ktedonobacteraceae bacterium]|nr:electron transfer flavoprotein subunit beta/FixA family protein [Ktedonobacteraceae bacterium]
MRICVCVKQTPDSSSVYVDPISGEVDVERFVQVLNAADACAVEAAVRLKEQLDGTVLALTLGPQDAEGALRAALAIGANEAIRLWNPVAADWGPFTVAAALAASIQQIFPAPDLVLCGDSASDWSSGIVGPALAELLDLPQITSVTQLSLKREKPGAESATVLQAARKLERGYRELLEAHTPLLLAVTADLNEPRYPSLPAHVAALKADIPVYDPTLWFDSASMEEVNETTLLEMHVPRPLPRHIPTPNSHHSAFERIGEILTGGTTGRQTRIVEGSNKDLARVLVEFLREIC